MVTAGIFPVARMSPLFELSDTALAFVTIIGATGALFRVSAWSSSTSSAPSRI
jgi:NADH:ubiquinone oxidoreductase subunit 5 (subunit L)/multisubunit Na+/H+ antiporter MnhA subunit